MEIQKTGVKIFIMFFLLLAIQPMTTASQINIGTNKGLQIFYPEYEYVAINEPFFLHIHASNITDGLEINNTLADCFLHLYNSTGDHILEIEMEKGINFVDWEIYISGGNFSEMGKHAFRIYCINDVGGTAGGIFHVNISGEPRSKEVLFSNIFLIIFLFFLIFAVNKKYEGVDFEKKSEAIIEKHDGNIGKTFIRGLFFGLMKNVFLWYYLIGWLIVFLLREIIMTFGSLEVYNFFKLIFDIYSFGFILVIVVFIGMVKKHFDYIQDIIEDISMGVRV